MKVEIVMFTEGVKFDKSLGTMKIPKLGSDVTFTLPTYTKEKLTVSDSNNYKSTYFWASFGLTGNPW